MISQLSFWSVIVEFAVMKLVNLLDFNGTFSDALI